MNLDNNDLLNSKPVFSLSDSSSFMATVESLRKWGGGSIHVSGSVLAASARKAGLGTFTMNYSGMLDVDCFGNWSFKGVGDAYDKWDFNVDLNNPMVHERQLQNDSFIKEVVPIGEARTIVGALWLPGEPFDVTSDPISIEQNNRNRTANFPGHLSH